MLCQLDLRLHRDSKELNDFEKQLILFFLVRIGTMLKMKKTKTKQKTRHVSLAREEKRFAQKNVKVLNSNLQNRGKER